MNARGNWLAVILCLLSLPAWAQSPKQDVVMQPMVLRPDVDLLSPADGDHFVTGQNVVFSAIGYAMNGDMQEMDIYLDGALYASAMLTDQITANWTATLGTHTVSAKATDQALSRMSPAVTITVAANTMPTVALTAPANGTVYAAGAAVPMTATASDSDGTIARVEFWVDGAKAGEDASSPYAYTWTATVGSHSVIAKAIDNANGSTSTAPITIQGNTAPTVSLTAPANGATYNLGATVPMTATASDSDGSIARVEFWVDGALAGQDTSSPYAYDWTMTAGSHSVLAKAFDNVGAATASSAISISINPPPTVSLTAPANGASYTTGAGVAMAATASDAGGSINRLEFLVDGNVVGSDTTSPYAYTWASTVGSHTLQARAVDNQSASTTTAPISITVTNPNVPPTVSLTAPGNGASYYTGNTVAMTATASDSDGSINRVEFLVDGALVGQDTTSPYAFDWTATNGNHTVQARAVDNQSATTATTAVSIAVNTPPTVSLTAPASGASYTTGAAVAMTATASDSDGSINRVEFLVDGSVVNTDTTSPYAYTWASTVGSHTLQARAVDNQSAATTTPAISITVTNPNTPPTVSLTAPANGASYYTGNTVAMTATASDSDGTVSRVEFWIDGALANQDTASPYAYNWTATTGSHTLQAKAVDNQGATTATGAIGITVIAPTPVVTLTAPANNASYNTGATVAMTATASETGGSINRVEFLVDGAVVGQDTTSPYAYNWTAANGDHSVQARAVDALGAAQTSAAVTVHVNTPPTVSLTAPANGASYTTGAGVAMTATANDSDGSINRVEFMVDGAVVYTDTASPYAYTWTSTVGSHSLQARAVDNQSASTTTTAISVTVNNPNVSPTVSLTAPTNGATYTTGAGVAMTATANDSDGSINRVEFMVDGAVVYTDTTSPYAYTWTSTVGSHSLQARAVDNQSASTTTTAISITVSNPNTPPTVSLTAPANGATFAMGATVAMGATASDSDGSVARVEFWVDGANAGQDTSSPYAFNWTATAGSHTVLAKAVDNLGATTSSAAVTIQVAASIARNYFYNGYQELCRVDEPETGATLMGYDAAGNLAWSASGLPTGTACSSDGNTTAILARKAARTYDARNRIVTLAFPDANGNQSWTYTPDGLPASVTTYNDAGASSVVNTYAYNKRRLLSGESQQADANTWSVGYGYTVNGHLATLVYPDSLTVAYAPNALGQATQAGSYATGVTYYPNGAIAGFTYGNGIVHTLTQNARGLPDRSRDLDGATPVHDDSYDYDPVGNVLAISDAVTGNRGDRDMVYDDLNRLTSATSPMFGTATYAYDVLDNLSRVTVTGGSQSRDHDYVYDAANRLTNVMAGGASVIGLGYDVQGNLANRNGVLYGFDYGNRMRSGGPESYRYDVQGRRVRSSSSAGLIYSLYSQSGQLLFQRDERAGKRRQYVYLGGSLVAESSVPLAGGAATVTYQHTDALGSPVATTNSAKTVLQRSEYEPYGSLLNRTMEDGPGYTGHVSDAATGLVYMQQRYYDPELGEFPTTDPVTSFGPGGTFNRYWYANANPYRMVDPDGRQAKQTQGCSDQTCSEPVKPNEDERPNGCRTKRDCWQDAAGKWHITPPTRKQLSFWEARDHYRNGNGEPIAIDQSTLTVVYSPNPDGTYRAWVDGLPYLVHGQVSVNPKTMRIYDAPYDFEWHDNNSFGNLLRNFGNIFGRMINGDGTPFEIIYRGGNPKLIILRDVTRPFPELPEFPAH